MPVGNGELCSHLMFESHTGQNIAKLPKLAVNEWEFGLQLNPLLLLLTMLETSIKHRERRGLNKKKFIVKPKEEVLTTVSSFNWTIRRKLVDRHW